MLAARQLRKLQLADVHSGRLHLDGRVIPLAQPVRQRITAWLTHRASHWLDTGNSHLFISRRTALGVAPVGVQWITNSIGMAAQAVREDRILDELIASKGDLRHLCDLFALTIAGATRYATTLGHPGLL